MSRPDNRAPDEMRAITVMPGVAPHATGSVLIAFGNTRVICTAMVEYGVPRWMKDQGVKGGWLTAEYSMLPYSTGGRRKPRDIARGKLDGRSSEIQRLIGRSLRAVVDLKALGHNTVWVDCDVLQADGGTRTASITGACIACGLAFEKLVEEEKLTHSPLTKLVAAVSAGVWKNEPILDLCYVEDRDATVDFNMVLTEDLDFVEVQGSGEEATFSSDEMNAMLDLGRKGISELCGTQRQTIRESLDSAGQDQLEGLKNFFEK